jgi:hypothetical protein
MLVLVSAIGGLTILSFLAFAVFRTMQFEQQDSYNSPYADVSTAALMVFLGAWLALLVLMIRFRGRIPRYGAWILWAVLAAGGIWVAMFLVGLAALVFGL